MLAAREDERRVHIRSRCASRSRKYCKWGVPREAPGGGVRWASPDELVPAGPQMPIGIACRAPTLASHA